MSYLLPAGTAPRTVNKWGLGHYNRKKNVIGRRGTMGLGQDSTDIDIVTGLPCDDPRANCGPMQPTTLIPAATTLTPPSQPGVNPAIQQAYANLLTTQQPSQNPLDYVSPQAAIAAGLPAQTVYNAWSAGLAKFPTQQAALNAGIPAGVVTQLWAQSRAQVPAPSTGTILGIPTNTLLLFGGGLFLLPMLLGGRRRR